MLIGYHRRHNSISTKVKNKISKGKLGKIVSVNVMCWLYKNRDWFKEKWRVKKGGGPLGINLVHDIDLICYLLGPVDYVQASSSNKIRKYGVEDTAVVNFVFKSGALGEVTCYDMAPHMNVASGINIALSTKELWDYFQQFKK